MELNLDISLIASFVVMGKRLLSLVIFIISQEGGEIQVNSYRSNTFPPLPFSQDVPLTWDPRSNCSKYKKARRKNHECHQKLPSTSNATNQWMLHSRVSVPPCFLCSLCNDHFLLKSPPPPTASHQETRTTGKHLWVLI